MIDLSGTSAVEEPILAGYDGNVSRMLVGKVEGPLAVLTLHSDENRSLPWRIALPGGCRRHPRPNRRAALRKS